MEYARLGTTGISVSKLCFGALTIGPLQRNLSVGEGSKVIRSALDQGVNFIDTAELYDTYAPIRRAVNEHKQDVIIATKSYAYTKQGMKESLEKARRELDRDVIDIFMLHEQESIHTLRGHYPALEVLMEAKEKGTIKAVGISTHHVPAVLAGADLPEIDVISPLVNHRGIGILGGNLGDMLSAIKRAASLGKGIYAMKPLGGGHLLGSWQQAFDFLLSNSSVNSIAVGMKSLAEVSFNLAYFSTGYSGEEPIVLERKLHIDDWCVACGKCVKRCPMGALSINNQRAQVDQAKCVYCGYCGSACPEFAIKVI